MTNMRDLAATVRLLQAVRDIFPMATMFIMSVLIRDAWLHWSLSYEPPVNGLVGLILVLLMLWGGLLPTAVALGKPGYAFRPFRLLKVVPLQPSRTRRSAGWYTLATIIGLSPIIVTHPALLAVLFLAGVLASYRGDSLGDMHARDRRALLLNPAWTKHPDTPDTP